MNRLKSRQVRGGFTLIELLVVMAIVALVATLGYMAFPSMSSRAMSDAGDRLQGLLLTAKQIARRDNRPTGVRLTVIAGTTFVNTLQYVQQPDDFIGAAGSTCTCAGGATVTFNSGLGVTGQGVDVDTVQAGDYICFDSCGTVYPISAPGTTMSLGINGAPVAGPNLSGAMVPYRIIRQPRVLLGEEAFLMPGNSLGQPVDPLNSTLIDMSKSGPSAIPARAGMAGTYEILFAPSGAVVGATSDIISLWVCNQNNTPPPVLVTLRTRTGLIGVNPVGPPSDPYSFTRDGRASGM